MAKSPGCSSFLAKTGFTPAHLAHNLGSNRGRVSLNLCNKMKPNACHQRWGSHPLSAIGLFIHSEAHLSVIAFRHNMFFRWAPMFDTGFILTLVLHRFLIPQILNGNNLKFPHLRSIFLQNF